MKIEELLHEDECVLAFGFAEGGMNEYYMISPCAPDGSRATTDLAACIEMTLHRILDEGGTEEDVSSILGARMRTDEDEESGAVFDIDLGYVMPYQIGVSTLRTTGERKLSRRSFLTWMNDTFTLDRTAGELVRNILDFLDKADMTPQEKTFALTDLLDAGIGITDGEICMCSFD